MRINNTNNFIKFKASYDPYLESLRRKPRLNYDRETERPTPFREDELFDEERDVIDEGYRIYDYDDLPIYKPSQGGHICDTAKHLIGISESKGYIPYTEPIQGFATVSVDNEGNTVVFSTNSVLSNGKRDFIETCELKRKDAAPEYSNILYNYFMHYRKKADLSMSSTIELAERAKLRMHDKSEFVDKNMIDAVIYCHKNYENSYTLLRTMVLKDKNKDESFSNEAFNVLKKCKLGTSQDANRFMQLFKYKDDNGATHFNSHLAESIVNVVDDEFSLRKLEKIMREATALVSNDKSKITPELIEATDYCLGVFDKFGAEILQKLNLQNRYKEKNFSFEAFEFLKGSRIYRGQEASEIVNSAIKKDEYGNEIFNFENARLQLEKIIETEK